MGVPAQRPRGFGAKPRSYPNVFRAQRSKSGILAKEVCDVLVVFEEHVVIFSDKDCVFPSTGDADKDWSRWYRRAVEKSALQLYGAERVLRSGAPLFLDPQLRIPFPLELPDSSQMRVHRILVAHAHDQGGSQCTLSVWQRQEVQAVLWGDCALSGATSKRRERMTCSRAALVII